MNKIIKNMNWMRTIVMAGLFSFLLPLSSFLFTSCSDDESDAPLNFYSSVRLTADSLRPTRHSSATSRRFWSEATISPC